MVETIKMTGYLIVMAAIVGEIFYILWFMGAIPWLDSELAVKIPVLLITTAIILIIGILGYIMATTRKPIRISLREAGGEGRGSISPEGRAV